MPPSGPLGSPAAPLRRAALKGAQGRYIKLFSCSNRFILRELPHPASPQMTRAGPVALRLKESRGLRRSAILTNVNGHLNPSKGGIGFIPQERKRSVDKLVEGERDPEKLGTSLRTAQRWRARGIQSKCAPGDDPGRPPPLSATSVLAVACAHRIHFLDSWRRTCGACSTSSRSKTSGGVSSRPSARPPRRRIAARCSATAACKATSYRLAL